MCSNEERRIAVQDSNLNGIDYLEVVIQTQQIKVSPPLLFIHCFKDITPIGKLDEKNIIIEGGVRIKNIIIEWAKEADLLLNLPKDKMDSLLTVDEQTAIKEIINSSQVLVIRPKIDGDFSTYTLLLKNAKNPELPPDGFDIILSQIDFSFKIECPSEFDCKPQTIKCLPQSPSEPVIDYLAKDFSSFRRLILDRLSSINPDWKERNPADIGIVLAEMLAYVGDHLSYYQDAIATEAYLGTALKRVSVKRHARLLDYDINDGCNARAWVCMIVDDGADGKFIPKHTRLLTGNLNDKNIIIKEEEELQQELDDGALAFETMNEITLYQQHNEMPIYTWGNSNCCLPIGATKATLKNTLKIEYLFTWENVPSNNVDNEKLLKFLKKNFALSWIEIAEIIKSSDLTITISTDTNSLSITLDDVPAKASKAILKIDNISKYEFTVKKDQVNNTTVINIYSLGLQVGDILVFEKTQLLVNGKEKTSIEPFDNHVVRLSEVIPKVDELTDTLIVEIAWDLEDALPFPLCISSGIENTKVNVKDTSTIDTLNSWRYVARGNVVLVDHGLTIENEPIVNISNKGNKFRSYLLNKPVTYSGPLYDASKQPASFVFKYNPKDTRPSVSRIRNINEGGIEKWIPVPDLLESDKFATEFVLESENDGTSYLRFGDGVYGKNPLNITSAGDSSNNADLTFLATYRIGNGKVGNVGPQTITKIVNSPNFLANGIIKIYNPIAAKGGTDPEKLDQVRLYAPQAFRKQERAVTKDDYIEVLSRHSDVKKAVVDIRWTGSWYTVFISIDRRGGNLIDDEFKSKIKSFLNNYRLAGYDIEITTPQYVAIEIKMRVCIYPNYLPDQVKQRLLEVFSNKDLQEGKQGFFHPDNWTFGQPLYLSKIYETAMKIEGVAFVYTIDFKRWGKTDHGELEAEVILIHPSEIIHLDNDPNFPENGKIEFEVENIR